MVYLFCVLLLFSSSSGEIFEGHVNQNSRGFGFMSKFCFDVNHDTHNGNNPVGQITVTLRSPELIENMFVMLFDDQQESWPEVYGNEDMTCKTVETKARNYINSVGQIEPRWLVDWEDIGSGFEWTVTSPIIQNIRPRWWYIALGSCLGSFDDIEYDIHMVQAQGSTWDEEFGINEEGLNTLYLVFFFYYVIFIIVHSVGTYKLRQKLEYTHPLVRLFFVVLLFQFVAVICHMFHYGIFSNNGRGIPGLNSFAGIIEIFARVFFLMILMLLAKGWTINNAELTGRKRILTFSVLFLVADVLIVIWIGSVQDPAETSVPTGLLVLYCLFTSVWFLWCLWFGWNVLSSYKAESNPPKKKLYVLLALIYIPWFFGTPFVTLLQFALDPWVRDKVIYIFGILISTIGYSFLAFLLWPSRAEDYFAITGPDPMSGSAGIGNYEQL